jgi:hypothetical protein
MSQARIDIARETGISVPEATALNLMERGSVGEALAGGSALILAILGLIGLLPQSLGAIAFIAAGLALLLGGASVAARIAEVAGAALGRQTVARGMELVALAGTAAIALGILALVGVVPSTLLGIAALVLGVGLLAQSAAVYRLEATLEFRAPSGVRMNQFVRTSSGTDAALGLGVIVLGILALTGPSALTLCLIAALAVGAALIFSGTSVAARIFGIFH